MKRRGILRWITAMTLVLCSVAALLTPQVMAEEKPVSRIEWVQQLVKAFDMTVEEDNYPDNYFSDMEETSTGYRDLLVAVEFGVIDLEAGLAFEPDQPATREFAAHTLNFCLGFQLEQRTAYTYAESTEVSYPDDIQVAVNRGWFTLQDGKVLPQRALTSTEAAAMLKDAAVVIAGDKIDVDHNNSFTYESGVVEIPEPTPVEINEDGTITVMNLPVAVKVGTTFVIYRDGFPMGYKAISICEKGRTSVLTVEKVALDGILSSADAEGRIQGDLADFEAADGVDVAYIFADGSETTDRMRAARATKQIKDIVLNKTINGVTVSATLSNLSLDYGLSGGSARPVSARVILNGEASVSSTIPFSAPASIELGYIPVGLFGSITITADIGVDGTITLSYGCNFGMGVSYSSIDGFRAITDFSKESFSLAASFNLHMGMKIAANITNLEFIYGTIYARIGAQCNYTIVPHSEPEYPDLCIGTDSWMYANVGLNVGVSCWKIKESYNKQINIWGRKNSPIRTVSHFEDNVWVPSCTCDTTGVFGRYFTPINSRYYNDGRRDVVNMPTYTYTVDGNGNATITGYSGGVAALFIPETIDGHTVTAIGNRAFKGNLRLAAVTIPDTITEIGQDAFSGCTGLTSIKLPKNLKTLESDAFRDCTGLTSVLIPKTVESTHTYSNGFFCPFRGCDNLQEVKFEDGMTRIPNLILGFCGAKLNIVIPDSVTEIGEAAFLNSGIVAVTIPDTVTEIEEDAFSGCTGLTSIKLPKNLKILGDESFRDCTGLTSVLIPKTVENTHSYYDGIYSPFRGCNNLQEIKFVDGMTRIPNSILCFCGAKLNIVIPDSVTEIGEAAFLNSGIVAVTIPDTVTEIEEDAFRGCTGLTDVKLPKNLKTLGKDAFNGCTGLTSVLIPKTVENTHSYYDGIYSPFRGCNNLQEIKFVDGMTRIPNSILCFCAAKLNIVIPDSVTEIGEAAFLNSGIVAVTIPDTVTEIEEDAFRGCTGLTDIKLPESVVNIGTKIFANCTSLTDVTLPSTWESIPASTFAGCTALEKLVLPESVKNIRDGAFKNCTALKEIVWSKAPELIDSNAFYNCDAITEMDIPATVTSVGYQAFYDCDGLTKITIPDGVTSLGDSVFYDCDALTDVKLGAGITTIPASAFRHCDALEQLTVPRRVTAIKDSAFKDSVKFSSITIPRSVTSISANAFSYLDKLTIYGVAGTYAETFANTNSIKFVDRQVSATSASLDQTALTLNKGASGQLTLTVTPEDFTDEVVWKSSDTAVVTVSDTGLVKAVGVGTATIKVSVGKASASCKVTVLQPVTSISLNRSSLTVEAMDTFQLQASVYPSNAADRRIRWTSSDSSVAAVDESGLVTALKKGTATITSAAMDGSGVMRNCTVTVSNTAYICTSPERMESQHNYPDGCTDIWLYTNSGAQKLYVTFDERTYMEDGFDYLYIYDGNGQQNGKYTGTELAGATITVPGNTVKLQMSSDDSGNEWGFKVIGIRTESSAPTVKPSYVGASGKPYIYWSAVDGANRYYVYRSTTKDGTYTLLGTTTSLNYTDSTANAGYTYYYKVKALTADGTESDFSAAVAGTCHCARPTVTPDYLTSTGKPYLKWAAVAGASKYEVYRSGSKDGTYTLLGTTTAINYTDSKANAGYTYYYKVKAVSKVKTAANSYYSTAVAGTCHCARPTVTPDYLASTGKPYIKWTAVAGASQYEVYRSGSKDGTYTLLGTTTATNYTDSKANAGYTYYYKVKAVSKVKTAANSAYSTAVAGTCHCARPTVTPDYLASTGKPYIKWTAVAGASQYEVYRSGSKDGTYTLLGTTTATNYTDSKANAGYTYYYKVKAVSKVKTAANSYYSTAVAATCHCARPSVKITTTSAGKPRLTWDAVAGASQYEIYRATSQNGTYTKMYTTTALSYTNTSAKADTTYYYKVKAVSKVKSTANSSFSTVVSIKAK